MKKLVTLTALIVVITAVTIGAASFQGTVTPPDANRVNDYIPNVVDLYLPSNPTTGYSWPYEIEDPSIVSLRDEYFSQSMESDLVGAGGTHWFHISGEKPGITSVTFRYLRAWETDIPPAEQTTYRLSVNDQLDVMIWGVEVG